jgi:hypothetical protein
VQQNVLSEHAMDAAAASSNGTHCWGRHVDLFINQRDNALALVVNDRRPPGSQVSTGELVTNARASLFF